MTLKVTCLSSIAALEPWVDRWQRLHATIQPAMPFTSPHWVLPWLRHFCRRSPLLSDAVRCWLFERGDELVAVAPMVLSCRPGRGPVQFRELQPAGADANITELNALLCRHEEESTVFSEFAAALRSDRSWDMARWWARDGSALAAGAVARHAIRRGGERPMYVVELPQTWDAFKATRSRNVKESLRKCYNSLKRDGHAFSLRVRRSPDELPLAMDRFFALHRERAQASATVAHADWFASTAAQAFICEAVYGFAARDQARVFELEIGGEVVASRVGFVLGQTLYLYFSGYREAWSRYSVMTTTTAEAMRTAISDGLKYVNLSFGRDVSKTRWGPSEISYVEAVHTAPRVRSRGLQLLELRLRATLRKPAFARVRALLAHGR